VFFVKYLESREKTDDLQTNKEKKWHFALGKEARLKALKFRTKPSLERLGFST
jgi:hypothetical protein